MIHGKKRNGDLFKRLTESWGYTKPETVEEETTPLDEEMAADTETVTEEEEVQEEGGVYNRERKDDELEEMAYKADEEDRGEVDEASTKGLPDRVAGRNAARRLRPAEGVEAAGDEEVVAEADEEVVEEVEEEDDKLEEAIRRVVVQALNTIKANKQGSK